MLPDFLTTIANAQLAALQKFGVLVVGDVTGEPVTLAQAYHHLNIDSYEDSNGDVVSDDDDWLNDWIPAARAWCEQYLGLALALRTVEISATTFPSVAVSTPPGPAFVLRYGPVQWVESVSYLSPDVDSNGDLILDSNGDPVRVYFEDSSGNPLYQLDNYSTPSLLLPKYGESWPTALTATNSVIVRYTAGFLAEPDSNGSPVVPRMAFAAVLALLAYFYKNREGSNDAAPLADMPLSVTALLDLVPGRQRLGMA